MILYGVVSASLNFQKKGKGRGDDRDDMVINAGFQMRGECRDTRTSDRRTLLATSSGGGNTISV